MKRAATKCARAIVAMAFGAVWAGCGGSSAPDAASEAGMDSAAEADVASGEGGARDGVAGDARVCVSDPDCSDGLYCNGVERCLPGATGADARGCVAAASVPCSGDAGQTCNEAMRACVSAACAGNPDQDNDGRPSIACGGNDCDDHDARRYPGNTEVCDDHDEDCDPCTVGGPLDADRDGDGFLSVNCTNPAPAGTTCTNDRVRVAGGVVRGTDCNDTPGAGANVNPAATELCDGIDENCDGLSDDADPQAQTACGTAPGTTLACVGGRCAVSGCDATHADCDNVASNGCECTLPDHAVPACTNAACGYACAVGFHACGAVCADDTSAQTCGASCTPCVAPAHGTATCVAGVCGFACDVDYVANSGLCVPGPRPIAPLSTSTVTSRRPVMRWELGVGQDSARVEICNDPSCNGVVATFDATGSSGAPSTDLPSRRLWWRVRPLHGGVPGAPTGVVWQMHVGARSAAVNTSWGTTTDLNGDGVADTIAGAYGYNSLTGRATGYLGFYPDGLTLYPTAFFLEGLDGPNANFGYSVASAGDVNGDGLADVIVGAYGVNSNAGKAYVYLSGRGTTPATVLTSSFGPNAKFGNSVASAGDVNGDGYADVAVGAPFAENNGRVNVYLGSAVGLGATPATSLAPLDGRTAALGISVASAGDVNGDGYADLIVGAPDAHSGEGGAYLYLGSATGLGTVPATSLAVSGESEYGFAVASAGDVNGDGLADVIVGTNPSDSGRVPGGTESAYVYLGNATGVGTTPASVLVGPDGQLGEFSTSVASAGDLNGDGFGDVIVGAPGVNASSGKAYIYLGASSGLGTAPTYTIAGGGRFGSSVAAGDINGDGYPDVIIGAPEYAGGGSVFSYHGNASGLDTTRAYRSINTGSTAGCEFGFSVATASEPRSSTSPAGRLTSSGSQVPRLPIALPRPLSLRAPGPLRRRCGHARG